MVTRASDTPSDSSSAARPRAEPSLHEYVRKIEGSEILVRDWHREPAGPARPPTAPRCTPAPRDGQPPGSAASEPEPQGAQQSHVVTLRWPRSHAFYTVHEEFTSPLLFTESVRQALAVLSHEVHRIPLEHRLGWQFARFGVAADALRPGAAPATVTMRITYTAVCRRPLGSVQVTALAEANGGGARIGSAEIGYITHPPHIYRRLRGRYADADQAFNRALPPGAPIRPAAVGRASARDVVLAPTSTARRWRLRTDTTHEILFDHPHDHVPGMVLLEAAAQATQADFLPLRVLPVAFETTFERYVELDQPCWITVETAAPDALGRPRRRVAGVQGGKVIASALVTAEAVGGDTGQS